MFAHNPSFRIEKYCICVVDESLVPENGANSEMRACRFMSSIKLTQAVNTCFVVWLCSFHSKIH